MKKASAVMPTLYLKIYLKSNTIWMLLLSDMARTRFIIAVPSST